MLFEMRILVYNLIRRMNKRNFYLKYTYFLLFYALLVILWGAFVRISGSGDGCGEHWPLCKGQYIPTEVHLPTWIEFAHRMTSAMYGIFILAMVAMSFRWFPRYHLLRRWSLLTLVFTITEALLGRQLVMAGLVAENASVTRAYIMTLHLLNSLVLVATIVLQILPLKIEYYKVRFFEDPGIRKFMSLAVLIFAAIACSGAIAALSTTIFPSLSLLTGLFSDFAENSHFLLKIRIFHPMFGIFLGSSLLYLIHWLRDANPQTRNIMAEKGLLHDPLGKLMICVVGQMTLGILTLLTLSPLALKLGHLLLAYTTWIYFILSFGVLGRKTIYQKQARQ